MVTIFTSKQILTVKICISHNLYQSQFLTGIILQSLKVTIFIGRNLYQLQSLRSQSLFVTFFNKLYIFQSLNCHCLYQTQF